MRDNVVGRSQCQSPFVCMNTRVCSCTHAPSTLRGTHVHAQSKELELPPSENWGWLEEPILNYVQITALRDMLSWGFPVPIVPQMPAQSCVQPLGLCKDCYLWCCHSPQLLLIFEIQFLFSHLSEDLSAPLGVRLFLFTILGTSAQLITSWQLFHSTLGPRLALHCSGTGTMSSIPFLFPLLCAQQVFTKCLPGVRKNGNKMQPNGCRQVCQAGMKQFCLKYIYI